MDEVETEFLKSEPFLWLRYINGIFFIWTHGKQKLDSFHNELYNFHFHLSFTCETSTEIVNFVDLNVRITNSAIYCRPFMLSLRMVTSIFGISSLSQNIKKFQYCKAKHLG